MVSPHVDGSAALILALLHFSMNSLVLMNGCWTWTSLSNWNLKQVTKLFKTNGNSSSDKIRRNSFGGSRITVELTSTLNRYSIFKWDSICNINVIKLIIVIFLIGQAYSRVQETTYEHLVRGSQILGYQENTCWRKKKTFRASFNHVRRQGKKTLKYYRHLTY